MDDRKTERSMDRNFTHIKFRGNWDCKGEISMLDKIPDAEQMSALVGQALYDIWNKLCTFN